MKNSLHKMFKKNRKSSSHFPSRSRNEEWADQSGTPGPSDVNKFINFSKHPTRNSSHQQDLMSNTDRMSIPISSMKMRPNNRASQVQSDRRVGSQSCSHKPKLSQTQKLCMHNFQPGRTLSNSKRSFSRRQLGEQKFVQKYLVIRQKSLNMKKKRSRVSSGKTAEESPVKLREMSQVLQNENKEFQRRLSMGSKKLPCKRQRPNHQLAKRNKNFWIEQLIPVETDGEKFNLVEKMNVKRRQLLKKLLEGNEENVDEAKIIRVLRQKLKSKKKAIFNLIQENRKLEYKWKEANVRLENFHQSKIEKFEYIKKLILRDKGHLSKSEMSIVSEIHRLSKPQIQFDISKILPHDTRFVRMNESSLAASKVQPDMLLLSKQSPSGSKELVPIYSDSTILT